MQHALPHRLSLPLPAHCGTAALLAAVLLGLLIGGLQFLTRLLE